MKHFISIFFTIALLLALVGCHSAPKQLTLEKTKELAQKGEDLTWSDFEDYESEESGSGLRILTYPLSDTEDYCVIIGGGPTTLPPLYIYLAAARDENATSEEDSHIDIRRDSIGTYLSTQSLKIGTYALDVNDGFSSSVSLKENGEFTFSLHILSSYLPMGTYTVEEDQLILSTADEINTYVFTIKEDTLILNTEKSSEMPQYNKIPNNLVDGAVFQLMDEEE